MNPKLKKFVEIFIFLWIIYYVLYLIAYVYFLDSYCSKYGQNIEDTKKMNLLVLWKCEQNYFCKATEHKYILGKLSSYKCSKKIIDRYEYSFYKNKFNELIK